MHHEFIQQFQLASIFYIYIEYTKYMHDIKQCCVLILDLKKIQGLLHV